MSDDGDVETKGEYKENEDATLDAKQEDALAAYGAEEKDDTDPDTYKGFGQDEKSSGPVDMSDVFDDKGVDPPYGQPLGDDDELMMGDFASDNSESKGEY